MNIGPVIKPKSGHNRYCGPAALSMILHIDTAEAAALLRTISGKKTIKGVQTRHAKAALEKRGHRVELVAQHPGVTLAQWLKANPVAKRGTGVFLIAAGNHFVVVQGLRGGCNQTGGPGPLLKVRKRRAKVQEIMLVHPVQAVAKKRIAHERSLTPFKTMENAREAMRKAVAEREAINQRILDLQKRLLLTQKALDAQAKRANQNALAKAKREAAKAGIRIELERDASGPTWWVFGPEAVYGEGDSEPGFRADPCNGCHGCYDQHDVVAGVQDYLDDLAKMKREGVA